MKSKLLAAVLCMSLIITSLSMPESVSASKIAEQTSIIVESDGLYQSDKDNVKTQIGDFYILNYDSAKEASKALKKYRKKNGSSAEYAEQANLSAEHLSWGPAAIGTDALVEKLKEQSNLPTVTVAVIDSGVDYNHPLLKDRVTNHSFDFVDNDGDAMDEFGHGTHVAGIIADTTSSNVKIASYRVADKYGNASIVGLIEAIKQAIDDKVDIINLSMGSRLSSQSVNAKMLAAVLSQAYKKGIVIVAATGNEGTTAKTVWPACYCSVVAVSALKETNGKPAIADFSNYGDIVDFCAPGYGITSSFLNGEYKTLNGTSMATPFVSSAFALIKSYNYDLSPQEMENVLKENALDLGDTGFDKYYGYGMINTSSLSGITAGSYEVPEEPQQVQTPEKTETENKKDQVKVIYAISYDLNGGVASPYAPKSYIAGQATFISPVYNPTKEGCKFAGWYFDPEFRRSATYISKNQTGDITLYARWTDIEVSEKKKQTVSFKDKNLNVSQSVLKVRDSSAKLKASANTEISYEISEENRYFSISDNKLVIRKGTPKGIYKVVIRAVATENEEYSAAVAEATYTITAE